MSRKRVLEFATYAGSGGTQREVVKLVSQLSRKKYDVCVCVLLSSGVLNEELSALGIENISLNMRHYFDLRAWWRLYSFAKNRRFDLIRTYGLKAHIVGRIVGRIALRISTHITSVHSTDPWRKWHHTALDALTSSLTNLYISNSEAGRQATHLRERIPLSKIITIPNGIALSTYPSNSSEILDLAGRTKKAFMIAPERPILGIIANLRQMKGHKTIVDALPSILERFPNAVCLFVGEDLMHGEIHDYVRTKHLEQAVLFTGLRHDVMEILAMFDLFLLPSLWEGLPTSLLEAMAMRKPIIASNVGGIPELVEHQKTGVLLPPNNAQALANAVNRLLSDPELAAQMGEAGYCRAYEHFALETIAERTGAVYDRLIENGQP